MPCLFCKTDQGSLHDYESCSLSESPWPEYGHPEWLADIRECLTRVHVQSHADRDEILAVLELRKVRPFSWRLAVSDLHKFGISKFDKLLACGPLETVHDLDTPDDFPCYIYFSDVAVIHS